MGALGDDDANLVGNTFGLPFLTHQRAAMLRCKTRMEFPGYIKCHVYFTALDPSRLPPFFLFFFIYF